MKLLRSKAVTAACALALAAPWAAHADLIVGTPQSGNCYPMACFASDGGTTFQQVYAASAFSGLTTFDTVSFFQGPQFGSGTMDSASYALSFYLTPRGPNGLSQTGADNRGSLLASFGNFSFSGLLPATLDMTGSLVNYDPLAGNLLMDVTVSGASPGNGYQSSFQADYSGTVGSRYFAYRGSTSGYTDSTLVVTKFSLLNAIRNVPEPATWTIVAAALAAMAIAMRRQYKPSALHLS